MTLVVPPDELERRFAAVSRRSKLTPRCHLAIVDAVSIGAIPRVAAQRARVGERTIDGWLRRGLEAEAEIHAQLVEASDTMWAELDALDPDPPAATEREPLPWSPRDVALAALLPPRERPYWHLLRDVEKARADFEIRQLATVQEYSTGFEEVETITVEELDVARNVIKRTVTTKRKPVRSWQAAMTLLERTHPDRYAQTTRMQVAGAVAHEVAGPGGGPIEILARMDADERDSRTVGIVAILVDAGVIPDPAGLALEVGRTPTGGSVELVDPEDDEVYPAAPDE